MHRLALLPLLLVAVVSCANRPNTLGPVEYAVATGATATVREVAATPHVQKRAPEATRVLNAAAGNLESSLQIADAKPEAIGQPLITSAQLEAHPVDAAAAAEVEAGKRDEAVKKEQEGGWLQALLGWGSWVTVGGLGLWVARILNVPGVQFLSDPLIKAVAGKFIKPLEVKAAEVEQKAQALTVTVESSLVGRYGLRVLNDLLTPEIKAKISAMTDGRAEDAEELFKLLAKSHAVDAGQGSAVTSVIDAVKDMLPTTNGQPLELATLLQSIKG